MKKAKYNILLNVDSNPTYKEVGGYIQEVTLSNGTVCLVGLHKDYYWNADDFVTGLSIAKLDHGTRREALQEGVNNLEKNISRIEEARKFFMDKYNIKLNIY